VINLSGSVQPSAEVEQGRVDLLDAQVSVLLKSVDQRYGSDTALRLENHAKTA
jgi:hypothetical protein